MDASAPTCVENVEEPFVPDDSFNLVDYIFPEGEVMDLESDNESPTPAAEEATPPMEPKAVPKEPEAILKPVVRGKSMAFLMQQKPTIVNSSRTPGISHYYHLHLSCVLTMRKNGYTLTNGWTSIVGTHLERVSKDLFWIRAKNILFADDESRDLWLTYTTQILPFRVVSLDEDEEECFQCRRLDCHVNKTRRVYNSTFAGQHLVIINHHKDKTEHDTVVSMCMTPSGYTITNGRYSVSFEGSPNEYYTKITLLKMAPIEVYAVDHFTNSRLNLIKFKTLKVKQIEPVFTNCPFCKEEKCHRYRAVEGLAQATGFDTDYIRH